MSLRDNYAQWEVRLDLAALQNRVDLSAGGEDSEGNVEKRPHVAVWSAVDGLQESPAGASAAVATGE
jgi:hypothetical protein